LNKIIIISDYFVFKLSDRYVVSHNFYLFLILGLTKIINDRFQEQFCTSLIRKVRKKQGWTLCGPRYCQLIRDVNCGKRLEFCLKVQADKDQFDDVIFTDESTIEMDRHGRICFRKRNRLAIFKPRPKHPYKVHVWAGISKWGPTDIKIFTGIMRKEFFADELLKNGLIPFVRTYYPDGHRFQQDNDPKHTSHYAADYLKDNGINWWPTPPESPDLNPIELIWHELKTYIRTKVKPINKEQLVDGIAKFWTTVDHAKCTRYINHLHKVVPMVILREGKASGY